MSKKRGKKGGARGPRKARDEQKEREIEERESDRIMRAGNEKDGSG